jgi:WD40 repeat protein
VASGNHLRSLLKALGQVRVRQAAFHPNGKLLLLGCEDDRIRLWDAETDVEIAADRPMVQAAAVTACAFGPEGRSILSGCRDGTAQLWDAASGMPLIAPLRHEAEVSTVAFSPDGRILLTGSLDGSAHFWDAHSGFPLGPTLWHSGSVSFVTFHPKGRRAATGGKDSLVQQWHVPGTPLGGDVERVRLRIELLTDMELDEQGAAHRLTDEARETCRRRLEEMGGISAPSG